MYIVILNDNIEEARVYENLTVLNTDLDINPYTLTNFFSRNKGKFYSRGKLTVIKTPIINRRFIMALNDQAYNPKTYRLDKDQKDELEKRKEMKFNGREVMWTI